MRVALLCLAALLTFGCSPYRNLSNEVVRHEGFATVVVPDHELVTKIRIIGPEESTTINGWLLRFKTPYKSLGSRSYRVPAGTVVFTLKRGRRTKRGIASFGFNATAGRTYELRLDEIGSPKRVTIIERETGRVATPLSQPKRFAR